MAWYNTGAKKSERIQRICPSDFCKKIQEKTQRRMLEGHESDSDPEEIIRRSDEDEDAPFIHHPFKVSERAEIVMNIRVSMPARSQLLAKPGNTHHASFIDSCGTKLAGIGVLSLTLLCVRIFAAAIQTARSGKQRVCVFCRTHASYRC